MTHQFSVEVHTYLSEKIKQVRSMKEKAGRQNDNAALQYYTGQLEELNEIREFLSSNFDLDTQAYY